MNKQRGRVVYDYPDVILSEVKNLWDSSSSRSIGTPQKDINKRSQRGQAFILVLILLMLGAMVIVPTLRYSSSALISQRISEQTITERYAADAALEDAIWNIVYDFENSLGTLDPVTNTEFTYDFTVGKSRPNITMQIPLMPLSDWEQFQQASVKVEVVPNWLGTVPTTDRPFNYIIRMHMPQWQQADSFQFVLPQGLKYYNTVTGTRVGATFTLGPVKTSGPANDSFDPDAEVRLDTPTPQIKRRDNQWVDMDSVYYTEVFNPPSPVTPPPAYLVATVDPDGRQRLKWMPSFYQTGKRMVFQVVRVTGIAPWGISYIQPEFTGSNSFTMDPTGALGVAVYNIIIDVEGTLVQVTLAVREDGTVVILSYQIL